MVFFISGCSSNIIPETGNQFQVVGYSQLISVTQDVNKSCRAELLTKKLCADLLEKIRTAASLIDSDRNSGKAAELITYIRSKL